MTNYWNDWIMSEMVYHLSAKQGLDKERTPDLWALSEGNSRGLKKAQKCFYNAQDEQDAMNTLRATVSRAIEEYEDGTHIIESQDEELAELLTEGYVQGLVRAWVIVTDDPDDSGEDYEPPQDLSGSGYKDTIEVT